MIVYVITRYLGKRECPWLEAPIRKGTRVYHYADHTYGCISSEGLAVTLIPYELPFFEVPRNALRKFSK